jgi:MATE family multidrug resistance protein
MNELAAPPVAVATATTGAVVVPAQRRDAAGHVHVDYRAVASLALPLMLNSSLQAVVSLTDTWFVGHISTTAMAGMGAVYWVVLLFIMLIGGVGLAVQTFVAQAEGSRRRTRASHATWVALWASLLTVPLYAALAFSGPMLFTPFGLAQDVFDQAMAFWRPRMLGAPLAVALWAVLGFYNGVSQPRIAVITTGVVAIVNAVLNWLFVLELDQGIAGSAWATNLSMTSGIAYAMWVFLRKERRQVLPHTPHVAAGLARPSFASTSSACRWARCTHPTCSAWPCSS